MRAQRPARVPPVDRWPRVIAAAAQAPGELMESDGQRFQDGDSPGRCGDGGAAETGQNDGASWRWRRYSGRLWKRKGSSGSQHAEVS
jgi:hypothetical protein